MAAPDASMSTNEMSDMCVGRGAQPRPHLLFGLKVASRTMPVSILPTAVRLAKRTRETAPPRVRPVFKCAIRPA